MKKVVLYLEEVDLNIDDFDNMENCNVEWVDEESEVSLFGSRFVDTNHDEYPSSGRMYVRMNGGSFVVRRIREE